MAEYNEMPDDDLCEAVLLDPHATERERELLDRFIRCLDMLELLEHDNRELRVRLEVGDDT